MLAICSDLDETPDRHTYSEIARFLNTEDSTPPGVGVGLEVGNTIYFDMPPGQFAYWNTDDAGRDMVDALITSGHIDCLHSFGDLATTRAHVERALAALERLPRRLAVWIDHATAPTNFGADIMQGSGDVKSSPAYHADLTIGYGIRYVWRGRVTSVIGQEVPPRLDGVWSSRHPLASARTLAKEAVKQALGRRGSIKYAMHPANRVLRQAQLRDDQPVIEFLRCNPSWGGVSHADTADGLAGVLTDSFLDRLVARQGVCVLYTHLGKSRDPGRRFPPETVAALKRLAERFRRGEILVLTTRRLLDYLAMRACVQCRARDCENGRFVDVQGFGGGGERNVHRNVVPSRSPERSDLSAEGSLDEGDAAGLTVYVRDDQPCEMLLNGRRVPNVVRNRPDETGRASVSVPWRRLTFPTLDESGRASGRH